MVLLNLEMFFSILRFAHDAEVNRANKLNFGGINLAVDEDDLDLWVKAGSPLDR